MTKFHSIDYIKALKKCDPAEVNSKDAETPSSCDGVDGQSHSKRPRAIWTEPLSLAAREEFGLVDDCAPYAGCFRGACAVAGASLMGADLLARGHCDVAINWGGGRHHGRASKAEGFCFLNDAVLAILHLGRRYRRVLYVDIDVHHGDGVQEAFYEDPSVFTLSLHHRGPGFYPGSGAGKEVGVGAGLYRCLNLPLRAGASDSTFSTVFSDAFDCVLASYKPQVG